MVLLRTGNVLISWDAMWQVDALRIRPLPPSDTVCEVQPFSWGQRICDLAWFREVVRPLRSVMLKCWCLLMERQVLMTQVKAI